ncbi:MAG: hypothetical protein GXP50_01575 [Deltaproteobacteria bacterium]|nr:hypothetical protein [Deltaproteobacteria bacterium]
MGLSPRSKIRAFGVHLGVSAVTMGLLLWLFVSRWFPLPYFVADGGWQGLRLIVGVDLVLGPLLTLIVYNPRKTRRALLIDYSVIATLQAVAFGWGLWTVAAQRTALVVFADGAFYSVSVDVIPLAGDSARKILEEADATPVYAVVRMPPDEDERQRIRKTALTTGRPVFLRGDLMERLTDQNIGIVREYPLTLDAWRHRSPVWAAKAESWLKKEGLDPKGVLLVPLVCRYRRLAIVLQPDRSESIAFLREGPPQEKKIKVKRPPAGS